MLASIEPGRSGVERQLAQRLAASAVGGVLVDVAEHREQPARAEADARPGLGGALQLGLEDRLDGARGELRAREVAPEPVELVRDPREHQPAARARAALRRGGRLLLLLLLCCWPVQAP